MVSFVASFNFSGSFLDSLILVSSLECVKFIEFYCRNCIFLKNPLCHFKPPGACYKGLLYFKTSGRPRPGQDVYFLENWHFL